MDANLIWRPTFLFGVDAQTLTLSLPVTRWDPGARTEGRFLKAATGAPGPSLRLRKYLLNVTLRFLEEEWPDIIAFLNVVQMGAAFTWIPNGPMEEVSSVTVYWEAPHLTDVISPTRDAAYLSLMTLPIVLSRTDQPWPLEYYRTPA